MLRHGDFVERSFGHFNALYEGNLRSRFSSKVMVEVGFVNAKSEKELGRQLYELPWQEYLRRHDTNVKVKVMSGRSRLHSGKVERLVKRSLEPYSSEESENLQRVIIDIHNDKAKVLINSSGDDLSDRFYRPQSLGSTKFPLPCNMAAACLEDIDFQQTDIIVDPFCGSGPILIEAALKAMNMAPGLVRAQNNPDPYAFLRWPNFDPQRFASVVEECRDRVLTKNGNTATPVLYGSDRDEGIIKAAQAFAKTAGVDNLIRFEHGPMQEMLERIARDHRGARGWIVTNPPWGVRGRKDTGSLRRLYSALGDSVRQLDGDWRVALLSPTFKDARMNLNATGFKWRETPYPAIVSRDIPLQVFTSQKHQ